MYHFIDQLSRWDVFVSSDTYDFFNSRLRITATDRTLLKQYARERKAFHWEFETDLFEWAYKGFSQKSKFKTLIPIIKYFEARRFGVDSLGHMIAKDFNKIKKLIRDIDKGISKVKIKETVKKLIKLFGQSGVDKKNIPCYLFISYGWSTGGSSNGYGLSAGVNVVALNRKDISSTLTVISHEYLHKVVKTSKYFYERNGFYKSISRRIYPGPLDDFADEIIIHYISDIFLGKGNIDKSIRAVSLFKRRDFYYIWRGVQHVAPVLFDYLNGRVGVKKTRILLDETLKYCIKLFQKEVFSV